MIEKMVDHRRSRCGLGSLARTGIAMLLLSACGAVPASAQDAGSYPDRPVRIIVPLAPGGSVDLVARITAEALTAALGKSFIIENLAGGGGTVGTGVAGKARADGYTLVVGSSSTFGVNPSLMKNLPYDAKNDFEPVSLISFAPNVLVVPAALPVSNVQEFVALAKSKPGELSFASSGTGGSPHLAGELFKREAGIDLIHVPYKSSGQSMTDLLGGRVSMSFATAVATREQIMAGGLKALAVTTTDRVESLPNVPTMAEAGYPAVRITAWNGLLAPAGTPPAIVKKLNTAIQNAMHSPAVIERLKRDGAIPVGSTPEEFKTYIADEIARWAKVIKAANITVE